jgi:hypothetical protein
MKNLLLTLAFIILLGNHVEAAGAGAGAGDTFTVEEIRAHTLVYLWEQFENKGYGNKHYTDEMGNPILYTFEKFVEGQTMPYVSDLHRKEGDYKPKVARIGDETSHIAYRMAHYYATSDIFADQREKAFRTAGTIILHAPSLWELFDTNDLFGALAAIQSAASH